MRLPLDWLREYVPYEGTAEELGERFTLAGLELEAIERPADDYRGVLVGEVLEVGPHPNADRLTICSVTTGGELLPIVCGAPNVAAGQRVAVAMAGSVLPGGMKVKKVKIRGAVSHGMICSERELDLGEDADGILVLPPDAPVGTEFARYQGLVGEVIELEVPPNRPDALSVFGLAREVAALFDLELTPWSVDLEERGAPASDEIEVVVEDPEGCPRYAARLIRGAEIGPSPAWMAGRLRLAGVRPINVIVDITNYVMLELGQPQHAFDLRRIADGRIIVRRARNGESLVTLDGRRRALDPEMLLITDANGPVALAGVMGGADSEIGEGTTDILLESAHFDQVRVAIAGGRLGLLTESRRRFERGTDPTLPGRAADRAAALMAELAGGEVAPGIVEAMAPGVDAPRAVMVRKAMVDRLLGTAIPLDEMRALIAATGFGVEAGDDNGLLSVSVPSWRPDVIGEAHVAEEIARLYGYDALGSDVRLSGLAPAGPTRRQILRDRIRDVLTNLGLTEVITNTLVERGAPRHLNGSARPVELENPISEELSQLRTDLLPGVLRVVRHNRNRQITDLRIFELGAAYRVEGDAPVQSEWLVGALTGGPVAERWSERRQDLDWLDLYGLITGMTGALNLDTPRPLAYDGPALEPGLGAVLATPEGQRLGIAGLLSREVATAYDIDADVWVFGFALEGLEAALRPQGRHTGLPRFPASDRDVSVVLPLEVAIGPLLESVGGVRLVERVRLIDEYRGEQIPGGMQGITLSIRFRHPDKTLSEEEIESLHQEIVEILEREYSARLRT